MIWLTHMVWLFRLLGDPKKFAVFNICWYAMSRPSFLEQSHCLWIYVKKMSLPHYFSLICFWLRSNFMNHKPLSYGTSSHHTQCPDEQLSFEAATKARSSSDPCWVFGTVGLSASQVDITENVYSGPDHTSLQKEELIFSPALPSV